DRAERGEQYAGEGVASFRRSQRDLPGVAERPALATQHVAMRLPNTESAARQPAEGGPRRRHRLVDPGVAGEREPASQLEDLVEELCILAARLATRETETPPEDTVRRAPYQ